MHWHGWAGIAYALGILAQYANNNLVNPGGCGGGVSFGIPGGFEPAGHPNETGRPKPHRNDGDCGRLFEPAEDISLTRKKRTAGIMLERCW